MTPWLIMAGLGAYHGVNPAMGWLFAVSHGLQDRSRRSVLRALWPIALGHELSIALVVALVLVLEVVADPAALHVGAAAVLVGFGVFRFLKPRAHFRWVKGRVTRGELAVWSFLMSTAHGAGLMVAPVVLGVGAAPARAQDHALSDLHLQTLGIPASGLAVTVHVGAMLLVMGAVALLVYEKLGVAILRRTWLNLDWLWAAAFVMAGAVTLIS
jgi:hypothetical protein